MNLNNILYLIHFNFYNGLICAIAAPEGGVGNPGSSSSSPSLNQSLGNILDFAFKVGSYVGALLVIIGSFLFVMALKDDNAENQLRATKFVVVGIVCMGLKAILKASGFISY